MRQRLGRWSEELLATDDKWSLKDMLLSNVVPKLQTLMADLNLESPMRRWGIWTLWRCSFDPRIINSDFLLFILKKLLDIQSRISSIQDSMRCIADSALVWVGLKDM